MFLNSARMVMRMSRTCSSKSLSPFILPEEEERRRQTSLAVEGGIQPLGGPRDD